MNAKRLMWLVLVLVLAGCDPGMSDDEIRKAGDECRAKHGTPTMMTHWDGRVKEVRCW